MKAIHPNTVSILIPDGEWEVLTNHVKNCFSEIKEAELYIMSGKRYMPSRYSRYVKHYTYIRPSEDVQDWIQAINREVENHHIDIILPVYSRGIEQLIIHKDQLTFPERVVILPALDSFQLAGNKRLLASHMTRNSIPCPKSHEFDVEPATLPDEKAFPILAKPESDAEGGRGIKLLESQDSLRVYLKDNRESGIIYQEYIQGFDIDCSVLCLGGKIVAYTIQIGILAGTTQYAPPSGIRFTEDPRLLKIIQKLMKSLAWSGVAHIDCRYDRNRDEFMVLEVNTRYWTSLDGSLQAGINFPWLHVLLSRGEEINIHQFDKIEFLSLKGLAKRITKNPIIIGSVNYLWNNTSAKYAIRDPLPILVKLTMHLRNFSIRLWTKIRRTG